MDVHLKKRTDLFTFLNGSGRSSLQNTSQFELCQEMNAVIRDRRIQEYKLMVVTPKDRVHPRTASHWAREQLWQHSPQWPFPVTILTAVASGVLFDSFDLDRPSEAKSDEGTPCYRSMARLLKVNHGWWLSVIGAKASALWSFHPRRPRQVWEKRYQVKIRRCLVRIEMEGNASVY